MTIRDKATGQLIDVGLVHDEVSVLLDGDNKYFIHLIRGDHGDLYRIGYYTTRRDGRLCLGSQYYPIMNPEEFKGIEVANELAKALNMRLTSLVPLAE